MTDPGPVDLLRLRDFARAAVDWTWEVDADLRIVALSDGAATVGGEAYMFLLGEPLERLGLLLDGPGGEPPIRRASRERSAFRGQLLETPSRRVFGLDGAPVLGGDGALRGFRGLARAVDAAAVAGERYMAAIGGELGAPLDAIIGSAAAMAADAQQPLSPHYADYARDIAAAGRHLLALLGDLFDPAGYVATPAGLERFALNEVVDEAAALIALRAAGKGIVITTPGKGSSVSIRGDRRKVFQILVNLLTNAVKFTPDGGRIAIDVGREGARATLSVRDSGPGVPPDERERVFAKFSRPARAREEGTGLGLHISRELARGMDGDLRIDDAPGPGARFTLVLPA